MAFTEKRKKKSASSSSTAEKAGPGRPKGNQGKPVLDRYIDEKGLHGLFDLWNKWKDVKKLAKLPPPFDGDEQACWLFAPTTRNVNGTIATTGYGEIAAWGREASRIKVHVLSHFIHTGEKPQPRGPKLDISHRCHRKDCFNPAHLVRETVETNGSRDYCLAVRNLGGVWYQLCPHTPFCLQSGAQARNIPTAHFVPNDAKSTFEAKKAEFDAHRAAFKVLVDESRETAAKEANKKAKVKFKAAAKSQATDAEDFDEPQKKRVKIDIENNSASFVFQ